jgi:putative transposase
VKYRFIEAHRGRQRLTRLCAALGVSRSGYYAWRGRPESERAKANRALTEQLHIVHQQSRQTYGALKAWRALRAQGVVCGRHRVARLRRAAGLVCRRVRRFRSAYAARNHAPDAPNRLEQCFVVAAPDQVWGADITFVPTRAGWLYLAIVLDLYARRVVGWAMSARIDQALTRDALTMAITQRRPAPGLIHHSDQGIQYTSGLYSTLLAEQQMVASMSRRGNC